VQAIVSAAQSIKIGDAEIALAGGAETMSRAPHALSVRSGVKMGAAVATDMMIGVLTDPFGNGHMGITAENVAERYGVSRSEQDALALQSQQRAGMALGQKRFEDQIVPVTVKVRGENRVVSTDEFPKPETTLETLSALRPAFKKDGTVTAGNASGINDGAAALVLMSREAAEKRHLKPIARILDYAFAGVDPSEMGMGPVPAVTKLLRRTGLSIGDFDVVESNEAFAAQACAVARQLGFDSEVTNPNGGAIALGHPIGATGAIITVKCMYELVRTHGRLGLITMCIGGGQGVALAIEAVH
jgi:acetyl-CoA C-acetyltransferase